MTGQGRRGLATEVDMDGWFATDFYRPVMSSFEVSDGRAPRPAQAAAEEVAAAGGVPIIVQPDPAHAR